MSGLSPPSNSGPPRIHERRDIDPQVKEAAEGLESLFLDTMFKAMRQTVQSSELSLENNATKIYRDMLDSETAKRSAAQNSMGLADQIVAYLEARGYTQKTGQPKDQAAPSQSQSQSPESTRSRTGGTDESSTIRRK